MAVPHEFTRTDVQISDPEEARELVAARDGSQLKVDTIDDPDFRVAISTVVVGGGVAWYRADIPLTIGFDVHGGDDVTFTTMLAGRSQHGENARWLGRGDVFIAIAPGLEEPCRADHTKARSVQLPTSLLTETAAAGPDDPPNGWRFLARLPIDTEAAARWNGVVAVFERLVADPQRAAAPLVINAAVRLLAATALDVFPNNAITGPTITDARDAHPNTVQRAASFIEANPSLDITVADIARAAYVSTRGVQLAFRRQLDTTPTAYLRKVRLDHARRELQEATAGNGVTVTRIALKWGFSTPSRFAAVYSDTYGETPRQTLER